MRISDWSSDVCSSDLSVDTPAAFGRALLDADAVYVPDMQRSTAGIHMKKVFQQLGVLDDIAAKIQEFPNGATAMTAMSAAARSEERRKGKSVSVRVDLGCSCIFQKKNEFIF